ncbi:MAG: hypothetical protein L0956_02555 [Candidatus Mariimomonas ferrooxydans]
MSFPLVGIVIPTCSESFFTILEASLRVESLRPDKQEGFRTRAGMTD